jgi:conjugal transfer ATP-binding protein TraC
VFNVQALEPELRPIGIHLIANFVWTQVRRERKARLLVVDEAWTLVQHAEGGAFLAAMARRARKYYLGLVTITQDVGDFLGSDHGRTVLANAALKLLMKQDSSTIEPVAAAFRLSEEERRFLLGAAKGEGLFFARGSHVALRVRASSREHLVATTGPEFFRSLANSEANSGVAAR